MEKKRKGKWTRNFGEYFFDKKKPPVVVAGGGRGSLRRWGLPTTVVWVFAGVVYVKYKSWNKVDEDDMWLDCMWRNA
jgi:hypothetical protein